MVGHMYHCFQKISPLYTGISGAQLNLQKKKKHVHTHHLKKRPKHTSTS